MPRLKVFIRSPQQRHKLLRFTTVGRKKPITRHAAVIIEAKYLESLRRGYEVTVGRTGDKEIDFVCDKRGEKLYVDREHAVELPEDADFIVDLIGCRVTDDEGNDYGKITDVMQPGGNDVYVISGKRGEVLVPALKSVVISVDTKAGEMLLSAARMREVAVFED